MTSRRFAAHGSIHSTCDDRCVQIAEFVIERSQPSTEAGDGYAMARSTRDELQLSVVNETGGSVERLSFPLPEDIDRTLDGVALLEERAGQSLLVVRTGLDLAGQGAFEAMRIDCVP